MQTGCCPHTAIRDDVTANLEAVEALERDEGPLDVVFVESGGDNLTAVFGPALADVQVFVLDCAGGDDVPRKGGPGISRADLLVINKTDLAPFVGADVDVMLAGARSHRGSLPVRRSACAATAARGRRLGPPPARAPPRRHAARARRRAARPAHARTTVTSTPTELEDAWPGAPRRCSSLSCRPAPTAAASCAGCAARRRSGCASCAARATGAARRAWRIVAARRPPGRRRRRAPRVRVDDGAALELVEISATLVHPGAPARQIIDLEAGETTRVCCSPSSR